MKEKDKYEGPYVKMILLQLRQIKININYPLIIYFSMICYLTKRKHRFSLVDIFMIKLAYSQMHDVCQQPTIYKISLEQNMYICWYSFFNLKNIIFGFITKKIYIVQIIILTSVNIEIQKLIVTVFAILKTILFLKSYFKFKYGKILLTGIENVLYEIFS